MRTRATGQSPGGFHVLASPKRVRRQPPPVRISRTPVQAPDSSSPSSEASEAGIESASIYVHGGSHTNGDASNRQSIPLPNISQKKSVSNGRKPSLSTRSRSMSTNSSNHSNNVPARNTKNTGVKRRTASTKKTQTSRSQKHISNSKLTDGESENCIEVQSVQQFRHKSVNPEAIHSILGKRDRSASINICDAAIISNILSNPKRARLSNKDLGHIDLSAENTPLKTPTNRAESKYGDTGQSTVVSSRSSQQGHKQPTKAEESTTSPTKTPVPVKTSSTPSTVPIRKIGISKVDPDNTENVETHLRRGMQSIMSRMNKYQYKPLPKLIQSSTHVEKVSNEDQIKNIEISNSSISQYGTKFDKKDSSLTQDLPLTEEKSENLPEDHDESNQSPNKSKNVGTSEEDRRNEAESLFRSSAPDATYQNILRAVAEWATQDTSKLPTRDEIVAFLENPRDSDVAEYDSLSPSIANKNTFTEEQVTEKHNAMKDTQGRIKGTVGSRKDKLPANRHVAFSTPEEPKIFDPDAQNTSEIPDEDSTALSSQMEPLTPKIQQSLKPPTTQGWSFLSTVKNMVASPLKVLGFGFVDSKENIHNVTKDIEFDFKPPITPTPSERRRVKVNGATTQQRVKRNISTDSTARNLKIPQTDRPIRQRNLDSRSPTRRIFSEKRKVEFLRPKKLDESQTPVLESNKGTNRRRKKPTKRLEVPGLNVETASNQNIKHVNKRIEEWPPKLDANRPVVDLMQAAGRLPRGPNGEDVAAMLCKGWLISKHHDSFIREVSEPKTVTFSSKDVTIEPTSSSKRSLKKKQKPNPSAKERIKDVTEDQKSSSPCGRSYGLNYEDDTSSDEEKIPELTDLNDSSPSKSSTKEVSRLDLPETSLVVTASPTPTKNYSLTDIPKQSSSTQALTHVAQRLPKSFGTPYTPRMPSNLRNVEALSPYLSQLTPTSSHSKALSTLDESAMALIRVDIFESPLHRQRFDWMKLNSIDPKLVQFNQQIISVVDDLPDYSFPSLELPILDNHNDELEFVS
ncbi:hypothetical protein K3495_g9874 [Podosphaera aphanis]|nr:hypothetical protein K3495_g9874 [Podosphaera aphanis]